MSEAPRRSPSPGVGSDRSPDPEERIALLLRDLRSTRSGLSSREAQRRLAQIRPQRADTPRWPAPTTLRCALWGVFTNRLLLYGIGFELGLAAAIIYFPPLQSLLATAALPPDALLLALPFPFIVWGADELRRWALRRRAASSRIPPTPVGEELSRA